MAFENIGKALGILRRDRGLSQKEFCVNCGIGRAQLSRYEAGMELMKLTTLERILAELAITPEEFFRFLASLGDSPATATRGGESASTRASWEMPLKGSTPASTDCVTGSLTWLDRWCPLPAWRGRSTKPVPRQETMSPRRSVRIGEC